VAVVAIGAYFKYSFTYDGAGNPLTARVEGENDADTFTESKSIYSTSGNYIKTVEDSLGNTVNYDYNETKGTLNSVTDANGKTTSYAYDNLDRLKLLKIKIEVLKNILNLLKMVNFQKKSDYLVKNMDRYHALMLKNRILM
jgi:hypothetical protein